MNNYEQIVKENPNLSELLTPRMTNYIAITPTPKQAAYLLLMCKEAFYGGAAGGGKSIALLAAALQFVDIPHYNALIIRDSYKNLAMPDSIMDVSHQWLGPTDAHWNEEKKRWTFPSGATLTFGFLERPKDHFNYQSAQFQFVGIDECVAIRENQALYLFSRMRKLKDSTIPIRFRCASNPPAREQVARGRWVKDRYVNPKTRHKDTIFVSAKMTDNYYLNVEDYRASLQNLDPVTRKQLEEGDWEIRDAGMMFDRSWFELVDAAPISSMRVRAWDLAATDPLKSGTDPAYTAGVKMSKSKDGIYYMESIVRFQKDPLGVQKMIRHIADMDSSRVAIWMEQEPGSSGKNTIDTYRRQVLPEFIFQGNQTSGSKYERACPFSSQCEAGNVKIVRGRWNEDFFEEAEEFPNGKYKDQIDAASLAYNKLAIGANNIRIRRV
jgi:predicted phage terminase large subunit-like protein